MTKESTPARTNDSPVKDRFLSKEFILYLFINLFGYMGLAIANAGITWYIEKTSSPDENAYLVSLFLTLSILCSFVGLILFNKFLSNKNLFKVLKGACLVQLLAMSVATLYAFFMGSAMAQTGYMLFFIIGLALINAPAIYIFQIVGRGIVDTNYLPISRASGNSVIELGTQIAGVIGAIALGILYSDLGVLTFVVVIISMAIAISLIFVAQKTTNTNVKQSHAASDSEKDEKIGTKKTLQYFRKHISILIFGVLVWAPTVVVAITNTAFPPYVDNVLAHIHDVALLPHSELESWTTAVFSASQVAYGIGGIAASLVAAPLLKKARISVPVMWAIFLASLVFFTFAPGVEVFLVVTVAMAFSIVFLRIMLNTSLMELVPKYMYTSILFVLTALGTLIQGGFTQICGILTQNDSVYDSFVIGIVVVVIAWVVTSTIGAKHDLFSKISKAKA